MKGQLLRFSIVGFSTLALYYLLLLIFVEYFSASISLASALAYILALVFNYVFHYSWTFMSNSSHQIVIVKYLMMVGVGFLINWLTMTNFATREKHSYLLVQTIVIGVIVVLNFVVGKIWVFRVEPTNTQGHSGAD